MNFSESSCSSFSLTDSESETEISGKNNGDDERRQNGDDDKKLQLSMKNAAMKPAWLKKKSLQTIQHLMMKARKKKR